MGFLFKFFIWFCGYFASQIWIFGLLMVVFWVVSDDLMVSGCFLVVGDHFLNLWWWLVVILMSVFLNGWW